MSETFKTPTSETPEILINVRTVFDNLSKDLNPDHPDYKKIVDFHKDHFGEEAILNLEITKVCDFCDKSLPLEHLTQTCEVCNKTYDTCSDCPETEICFRKH